MPFVTAGDPDLATTARLIEELGRRGVDLVEVGFPYSDPIADGPVIQASYTRALTNKLHVPDIFRMVRSLPTAKLPPLVAMVAYAIVFRMGPQAFVTEAKQAGFSGLIIPDLPADEAAELSRLTKEGGLDLVQLIAPTTPPARVERILASASGFLYCISVAGTTGVRDSLPRELHEQLRWLKTQTKLPLAVGFGISRPDQVGALRGLADGVIVGSALVRKLAAISEQGTPADTALADAGQFAAEMVSAVRA